ncbi:hypothetical protein [Bacillus sp. OTU530]|uniref:hypothetical protein n=1 Tax=Bacillus sp. OTU530 TaxID=3043862 RepID=UPI00313BE6F4
MGLWRWLKKKDLQPNQNHEPPLFSQRDNAKCDQLIGQFHGDVKQLKMIFDRASDVVFREFQLGGIQKGGLIF